MVVARGKKEQCQCHREVLPLMAVVLKKETACVGPNSRIESRVSNSPHFRWYVPEHKRCVSNSIPGQIRGLDAKLEFDRVLPGAKEHAKRDK